MPGELFLARGGGTCPLVRQAQHLLVQLSALLPPLPPAGRRRVAVQPAAQRDQPKPRAARGGRAARVVGGQRAQRGAQRGGGGAGERGQVSLQSAAAAPAVCSLFAALSSAPLRYQYKGCPGLVSSGGGRPLTLGFPPSKPTPSCPHRSPPCPLQALGGAAATRDADRGARHRALLGRREAHLLHGCAPFPFFLCSAFFLSFSILFSSFLSPSSPLLSGR